MLNKHSKTPACNVGIFLAIYMVDSVDDIIEE